MKRAGVIVPGYNKLHRTIECPTLHHAKDLKAVMVGEPEAEFEKCSRCFKKKTRAFSNWYL